MMKTLKKSQIVESIVNETYENCNEEQAKETISPSLEKIETENTPKGEIQYTDSDVERFKDWFCKEYKIPRRFMETNTEECTDEKFNR